MYPQIVTIKTQRNRSLILHEFPDGEFVRVLPGNRAAYIVYIDDPAASAASLRRASPYLADIIATSDGTLGFILPPPPKKPQRFRAPEI